MPSREPPVWPTATRDDMCCCGTCAAAPPAAVPFGGEPALLEFQLSARRPGGLGHLLECPEVSVLTFTMCEDKECLAVVQITLTSMS